MSQNTPSKHDYWRGKGTNPRPICQECQEVGERRFMLKPRVEATIEGKRTLVYPVQICKKGHVVINWDELAKIPD